MIVYPLYSSFMRIKLSISNSIFSAPVTCCCLVVSDSLWTHGLQLTRLPYLKLAPGVCSNWSPLCQWCHPTIILCHPLSCLQSFPASGSFLVNWLLASGGQSIGASVSESVLPMNIQGCFPLGLTGLISWHLLSLLQHHSSKAPIVWCSAFFMVQLSHPYLTTEKVQSPYHIWSSLSNWNTRGELKCHVLDFNIVYLKTHSTG